MLSLLAAAAASQLAASYRRIKHFHFFVTCTASVGELCTHKRQAYLAMAADASFKPQGIGLCDSLGFAAAQSQKRTCDIFFAGTLAPRAPQRRRHGEAHSLVTTSHSAVALIGPAPHEIAQRGDLAGVGEGLSYRLLSIELQQRLVPALEVQEVHHVVRRWGQADQGGGAG